MWMIALTTNTITAERRIGSHSDAMPTTFTSCLAPRPGPRDESVARGPERARTRVAS
jgi:hypothetical protein